MSVAVQCGHCGTLNSAAAGAQRLRCGHCGTVNAVPRSGAAPSAPGAPPGVAAPRRQRTQVVLTEPGRFCHWGCQKRCCGIVGAFVLLAVLGVVLSVTVGAALAATVVTLGPTLIILGSYYNRYAASTFKAQICYTFCEAVCWLVPLSVCIAFFDPWWDRVAGEPYELECSWRARSGGKLLVHALTFAAHCNESLSLLNPRPVGSWDGLPCSLAPLGLGNGSVALPDERGCFGGSALVALESAAVEELDGTRCPGLEETVPDALGSVCIRHLSYMGKTSGAGGEGPRGAFDSLFGPPPSSQGCRCRKSLHNESTPRYDFCASGTCACVGEPGVHGPCSAVDLHHNVTIAFHFNKTTVSHAVVSAYFRAAFLEETLKYLAVRRILFKDRTADSGALLTYGLAAAAGFATIENLQYAIAGGLGTSFARMVTSIPLHCCTGLIIGIHLGYRKFLGRGYVCHEGSLPCVSFLSAIFVPVLIHGSWNVVIMLPQDASWFPVELRPVVALVTLVLGFVYCRCAWMGIENVCVVHVKDLEAAGRISKPNICCCEPGCCRGLCETSDPLAQRQAHLDAGSSASESDDGGLLDRVVKGPSGELLPAEPPCQTREALCPGCGAAVRVNRAFPSDCPFCGFEHGDPC